MRRKDLKGIEIDPRDLPSELNEMLEQFVDQDFGCLNCKSLTQISRGLSLFDLV